MKRPRILCSDFILDIFFPNFCPGCGRTVPWDDVFCKKCASKLEYLEELPWQALFSAEINGETPSFDGAEALFQYKGTAKAAVLRFKNGSALKFADYVAERIVLKLDTDKFNKPDIITAVPMHRKKQAERTYNQAQVFAKAMAKQLGCDTDFKLLGHKKSSVVQHKRSRSERFKAADETYYIRKKANRLDGKCVMICDDIFTTGATLNSCSGLLKKLGANKVIVVTMCRTENKKKSPLNEQR